MQEADGYDDNQSPFFRLGTVRKLAALLKVTPKELESLAGSAPQSNYKVYFERSKSGKAPRRIEAPRPELKKVQRRIHSLLIRLTPPPFLFSAFPKRSSVQNAGRHVPTEKLVKLDIRKFFPSANGLRVYDFFHKEMECPPDVSAVLMKLTTFEEGGRRHLPTGGVTSPILSYFGYRKMFQELNMMSEEQKLTMSLLMDDVTFSGANADHEIIKKARMILSAYGLKSKRGKERVFAASRTKVVTGVALTRQGPRLPNRRRATLHALWRDLKETQEIRERKRIYPRLIGALFSAGQIESRFTSQGIMVVSMRREETRTGHIVNLAEL